MYLPSGDREILSGMRREAVGLKKVAMVGGIFWERFKALLDTFK